MFNIKYIKKLTLQKDLYSDFSFNYLYLPHVQFSMQFLFRICDFYNFTFLINVMCSVT